MQNRNLLAPKQTQVPPVTPGLCVPRVPLCSAQKGPPSCQRTAPDTDAAKSSECIFFAGGGTQAKVAQGPECMGRGPIHRDFWGGGLPWAVVRGQSEGPDIRQGQKASQDGSEARGVWKGRKRSPRCVSASSPLPLSEKRSPSNSELHVCSPAVESGIQRKAKPTQNIFALKSK